ncbi:hypothetical protein [Brachybacterium sp. YJGR34]|uniref:hypothetical protein n=1 Tax=Brachybacterium sp. YJGR34 TaxID=2059911 RepID=UPI000E0BAFA8|nr:hypothetical protein [Brachybacterium sp. YJGR34]
MPEEQESSFDRHDRWEDERVRELVADHSWASVLPETDHYPVWIHAPGSDPADARVALERIARANAAVDATPRPEIGLLATLLSGRRRREHREQVARWLAPYTVACEAERWIVRPVTEANDIAIAAAILDVDPAAESTVHDLLWGLAHHDPEQRRAEDSAASRASSAWLDFWGPYEERHPEAFDPDPAPQD